MESRFPAWRTQRGRPGVEDGRVDFAFERNTLRPPTAEAARDCRVSTRNVRKQRDEWLVPDLCGNGHRDPDGVVRRTIWDFDFR